MGRRFLGQITSPLFATASISQPLPHSVPLFLLSQYETELAAAKAMHSTESARVEALKAEHMEHRQSLVDEHDAETYWQYEAVIGLHSSAAVVILCASP